ncbi:MAG: DUF3438 family protein, partial [Sneathiellales bacterium]|nr:DUF3438 family protein [Sneathiellales bacterium]
VEQALDSLCRVSGLWFRYNKKSKTYLVMTIEQYNNDLVVYNEDITKVFTVLHQNVITTANIIEGLYGDDRVVLEIDTEDEEALGTPGFGSRLLNSQTITTTITNNETTDQQNNDPSINDERRSFDLSPGQIRELGTTGAGAPAISAETLKRYIPQEPPIYVTVNREHNLLYVRTSDEVAMKEIERIVIESDRPTPQVLLEMKILELSRGDNFRSLVDISLSLGKGRTTVDDDGNVTRNPFFFGNTGGFPLEGGTALFQILHDNISAAVELAEQENELKILATPMLLASNNRASRLFIGEERVITTGFETNTTTGTTGATNTVFNLETERRNVGNTLNIVPRINSDRTVTILVQQDNSSINIGATNLSAINNNGQVTQIPVDTVDSANIESTVIAKDGLTVAIGGMIRQRKEFDDNKVPVLGDIPVLGNLFKKQVDDDQQTELILLVTPHILTTPEEAEAVSKKRLRELSLLPELDDNLENGTKDKQETITATKTADLVSLAKFAARRIRNLPTNDPRIVPVAINLKTPVALIAGKPIEMTPIYAWRRNDLYLTVLVNINRSDREQLLREDELEGPWLAASIEHRNLAPAGSTKANGYMYLVSDRPFLDVIAKSYGYQRSSVRRVGEAK